MAHTATAERPLVPTRWVGVTEYAAIKNLSVRTVYTYLKDGLIPGAEQVGPGRVHRIPITD